MTAIVNTLLQFVHDIHTLIIILIYQHYNIHIFQNARVMLGLKNACYIM